MHRRFAVVPGLKPRSALVMRAKSSRTWASRRSTRSTWRCRTRATRSAASPRARTCRPSSTATAADLPISAGCRCRSSTTGPRPSCAVTSPPARRCHCIRRRSASPTTATTAPSLSGIATCERAPTASPRPFSTEGQGLVEEPSVQRGSGNVTGTGFQDHGVRQAEQAAAMQDPLGVDGDVGDAGQVFAGVVPRRGETGKTLPMLQPPGRAEAGSHAPLLRLLALRLARWSLPCKPVQCHATRRTQHHIVSA